MNGISHKRATTASFALLQSMNSNHPLLDVQLVVKVVDEVDLVDRLSDVEFINVYGGRDDPHKDSIWTMMTSRILRLRGDPSLPSTTSST